MVACYQHREQGAGSYCERQVVKYEGAYSYFVQVKQIVTDSYKILHFGNINTEYINIQVIQPYTAKKGCPLKNRVPTAK